MADISVQDVKNENAKSIWIGMFQFQSILAQWLSENNPPNAPITQLKESHNRLLTKDLKYSDLCRYLSLRYPFPPCKNAPEEELYLFLGKAVQDGTASQMAGVQKTLSEYLKKLDYHYLSAASGNNNGMFVPAKRKENPTMEERFSPSANQGRIDREVSAPVNNAVVDTATPSIADTPKNGGGVSVLATELVARAMPSPGAVALYQTQHNRALLNAVAAKSPAQYTVMLKEKGDVDGFVPIYNEEMEQEYPPVWRVTALYGDIVGMGLARSKKEAKHTASKDVWNKLTGGDF